MKAASSRSLVCSSLPAPRPRPAVFPPLKVIRHISSFLVSTQIREGPSMNDVGEILKPLDFLKVLKNRIYQTSLTYKFAFRSNSVHLSYVKVPQGRTRHDNTDRRHEERRSEISTRKFQCLEFVTHVSTLWQNLMVMLQILEKLFKLYPVGFILRGKIALIVAGTERTPL